MLQIYFGKKKIKIAKKLLKNKQLSRELKYAKKRLNRKKSKRQGQNKGIKVINVFYDRGLLQTIRGYRNHSRTTLYQVPESLPYPRYP